MFALAMLVRLGKVSEDDILETFDAFRRLDVNNDGVLNSRSIIAGMIHKRRRDNMRHVASSNDMLKEKSVLSVTGADNNAGSAPASYEMEYPPYWAATQNPSTFQQLHNSAQFSNQVTTPASETERTSLLARRRNYGTHHMRSMSG